MISRHLLSCWSLLVALASFIGCADAPFERVSAYDPNLVIAGRILGLPDTVFSRGSSYSLTLDAGPEFADVPRTWILVPRPIILCSDAYSCGSATLDENGELSVDPTPNRRLFEVTVRMGAQEYKDSVVLLQRGVTFDFICQENTPPCGTSTELNDPIATGWDRIRLIDGNGFYINYPTDSMLSDGEVVTIRDTSIVNYVGNTWRSRFAEGSTWIVRSQYGHTDSLRWDVRQEPLAPPVLTCPTTVGPYHVGDSLVVIARGRDWNGYPLIRDIPFNWALANRTTAEYGLPIDSGSFVPQSAGEYEIYVTMVDPPNHWAACYIDVLP
jgi:hypothetical protein